jgi:hypothetical protein
MQKFSARANSASRDPAVRDSTTSRVEDAAICPAGPPNEMKPSPAARTALAAANVPGSPAFSDAALRASPVIISS